MGFWKKISFFVSIFAVGLALRYILSLQSQKLNGDFDAPKVGFSEPTTKKADDCRCPQIDMCCCTIAELEDTNKNLVYPLFKQIVQTPFFSHFKINLCSDCDLWLDSPLCKLRDCSVCECENPPAFIAGSETNRNLISESDSSEGCDDQVDSTIDAHVTSEITSEWSHHSDEVVVDLRLNPERYTGYDGESAQKVWSAIHGDSCSFTDIQCDANQEMHAFNRIISGMHSSISLHIAHDYCVELDKSVMGECARWSPAPQIAKERVLDYPDRVENLYFTYAVLLRAVLKAGNRISAAVPRNEPLYRADLQEWENDLLPKVRQLGNSCPVMFDESSLFDAVNATQLRVKVEERSQMLQRIMRCVGCDRCKLWGSLQALGLHTALRVLFPTSRDTFELSRQEAVALTHTLERLSSSVVFLQDLQAQAGAITQ